MNWRFALLVWGCTLTVAPGMAVTAERASAAPTQTQSMVMPASTLTGAPVNTTSVSIQDFLFSPAAITVPAGATVTWSNRDNDPHSIVISAQNYRSAPMDTGGSVTHTFATPGQYRYSCGLHPQMTGLVIVRGANG